MDTNSSFDQMIELLRLSAEKMKNSFFCVLSMQGNLDQKSIQLIVDNCIDNIIIYEHIKIHMLQIDRPDISLSKALMNSIITYNDLYNSFNVSIDLSNQKDQMFRYIYSAVIDRLFEKSGRGIVNLPLVL